MIMIKAVVRNGRIETEEPLNLPDGTELQIHVPNIGDQGDRDNSPEGIATWLAWADSLEPMIFSEEELTAWQTVLQTRIKGSG